MAKEKHEVRIILRDWTKGKKANNPVIAEIHSRKETKNGNN